MTSQTRENSEPRLVTMARERHGSVLRTRVAPSLLLLGLVCGCVLRDFEKLPDESSSQEHTAGAAGRAPTSKIAGSGGTHGPGSTSGLPVEGSSGNVGFVGWGGGTANGSGVAVGGFVASGGNGGDSRSAASSGSSTESVPDAGGSDGQSTRGGATGTAPQGETGGNAVAGGSIGFAGAPATTGSGGTSTMVDTIPPVPGKPSTLTATNVSWKQVTLSWVAASDDVTPSNALVYRVYVSPSDNINSVTSAGLNGTLAASGTNLTTAAANLFGGKTNYLTVVVLDAAQNGAIYQRYVYTFEEAASCRLDSDCYSNACARFYRDVDQDGYGDPNQMIGSCTATVPANTVENDADCCDNGGDIGFAGTIHPGQTAWFSVAASLTVNCPHLLTYPFDYDCDGVETQQNTIVTEQPCPTVAGTSSTPYWSTGVAPACGERGNLAAKAMATHASGPFCITVGVTDNMQYCH